MGNSIFGTFHRVPVAERVGFEPTIRYDRIPDFESGAFDLSATSPERIVILAESAWSSLAVAMPLLVSTRTVPSIPTN